MLLTGRVPVDLLVSVNIWRIPEKLTFALQTRPWGMDPTNLASSEYHPVVAEWLVQRFYQTTSEDRGYQRDKQEIQNKVAVASQNEHIQHKLKANPNRYQPNMEYHANKGS
jgi:hypothetical protein